MHTLYTPATDRVDMTAPDAIDQILSIHRGIFGGWRMEGDDDQAPTGEQTPPEADGFPADTPVKDMTAEQQVAYWKHKARKHETRANAAADYDAIKAERDQLRQAAMTPDEKALEEVRTKAADAARTEERGKLMGQIVSAKIEGALRGRGVAEDRITALLGPLNTNYFLTESGEVDTAKVSQYAGGIDPGTQRPDTGQGRRGSANSGKESGSELYDRHYGKKK